MSVLPPTTSAVIRRNLKRLNLLRTFAIAGQFLALYFFWVASDIGLPGEILATILLLYSAVLGISIWRSHWRVAITEKEFFAHLLSDIAFFSALLYFSGGANNPFVSYYLVPICIAAATLPRSYSWVIALLSLAAYSALFYYHQPVAALSPHHHHGGGGGNLHLVGMWANFAVSAGLITLFVTQMAADLRRQEAEANRLREDELRNDQVMAVATLAAGTAHELGTPLNTMQLLLDDLAHAQQTGPLQEDISTLQTQVKQCKDTLQRLVSTAQINEDNQPSVQDIRTYLNTLLERWQVMRPNAKATINLDSSGPSRQVHFPATVAQSIHNVLNNAADASPEMTIDIHWDQQTLNICIRDYGPGLTQQQIEQLGQPFTSSKASGMGIGLFLTQTTLSRIGGQVLMRNAEDGGAITHITLPLLSEASAP
ncbi:HAMP domain-containing histidine kinase [bacterium SCSIO 12696]|nr:HAMP domain-containing histidine kinase [bacterium SCSIO 12696]